MSQMCSQKKPAVFSRVLQMAIMALLVTFSLQVTASVNLDKPLPLVSIQKGGVLVISGKKIKYQNWQSDQLTGKVYMIQHMAGRSSAKALNEPMIDRIKAAKFDKSKYQTVTVVNTDDAIWGTGGIVKGKLEDSKQEFPWSMMVLDKEGVAKSQWQLEKKSSAIIVVDKANQVRWMKDGELSEQEQLQVMQLLQQLIME